MANVAARYRMMGGRFALAALVVGTLIVTAPGNPASGQSQGDYVIQASNRLNKLITRANKEGYQLDENKFSIGGGWLTQGSDNWVSLFTITVKAGARYRFLASGDNDARDVDLQLQDLQGKEIAKDEREEPDAVVDYRPTVGQKVLVRVRLYASEKNVPCMCLASVMVQK
jgi:hypothetical protein